MNCVDCENTLTTSPLTTVKNVSFIYKHCCLFYYFHSFVQVRFINHYYSIIFAMRVSRVTIIREQTRSHNTINDLLLLFGQSLGLFSLRDKDKSCYRIFITLVRALRAKIELTSDELALQTGLSRGTVIHHLNRLMSAGIVTNYKNKYYINYDSLEELVKDLKQTVHSMLDDLETVAKDIDDGLNLPSQK